MPRLRSRLDRAAVDLRPGVPVVPPGLGAILTDADAARYLAWHDGLTDAERDALHRARRVVAVDFRTPGFR